ncbi:MAG: hypothetical protein ABH835_00995 [Patescibacteria group bacterium]
MNEKTGKKQPKSINLKVFFRQISLELWKEDCFRHVYANIFIFINGEITCLILFKNKPPRGFFDKDFRKIKGIISEIEHCLEAISLYNQSLERILKK